MTCVISLHTDSIASGIGAARYGEAPLVKVAKKLNPFGGKGKQPDASKDENGLISRKGYGSNTVMPMALANNKLPSVLQYINITYEVVNSENEVRSRPCV